MCHVIRSVQSHLLFCFDTIGRTYICFDLNTLYFVATEIYDYVMEYQTLLCNEARTTVTVLAWHPAFRIPWD